MKKFSILLSLSFATAAFCNDSTVTVKGDKAKDLYQALIQADLPSTDDGYNATVDAPNNLECSIAVGGVYTDNISRGSCSDIKGTAAAISIADALIATGVNAEAGMSHVRPSARSVHCAAHDLNAEPWFSYECTITADFSNDDK